MFTIVLNLAHRLDRRVAMQSQLSKLGLQGTFLEAVNGRAERVPPAVNEALNRTTLSASEVGCYLSHIKAWQHLLNSPHAEALILEDDAVLGANLVEVLQALQQRSRQLHVVRLGALQKLVGRELCEISPGHTLLYTTKNPSGTHGYYLTRAGAAMLLERIGTIHRAIDTEMDRYWAWGGEVLTLSPSVVWQDHTSQSDIAPQARAINHTSKTIVSRLTISVRKHTYAWAKARRHPLRQARKQVRTTQ